LRADSRGRADYGLDAPRVVRNLLVIGAALILTGILADIGGVRLLSWWGLLSGSSMLGTGLLMVWGSRVGKRQLATRTIEGLALRGGERILDVGCGHGLLVIAAAKKLATGRAFGVDIWSERDQADNRPAVTLRMPIWKVSGIAFVFARAMPEHSLLPMRHSTSSCRAWRSTTSQDALNA
jgi:hypothetical protein